MRSQPAFRAALAFSTGIVVGAFLPPGLTISFVILAVLLCASAVLVLLRPSSLAVTALLVVLVIWTGATKIQFDREGSCEFDLSAKGKSGCLVCEITDMPTTVGNRTRFPAQGIVWCTPSARTPIPAMVFVTYKPVRGDTATPQFAYGQRVFLEGTLVVPSEEGNPGEFSPRQYYDANGIAYLFDARGASRILDRNGGSFLMRYAIIPLRAAIFRIIEQTTPGEEGEFLKGLLLGVRTGMSERTRQAFVLSGTAHVLAVSGSNVVVVAGVLVIVLEFFRPGRRMKLIIAGCGVLVYMLLTGSQASVVRASVMALVFLVARGVQEKTDPYNALGVAAMIILGWDARQVFDVGFQLSFAAVLAIVHGYPIVNGWIALLPARSWYSRAMVWVLQVSAISIVATLGTLPITAIAFGRFSLIGLLANTVVVPATGFSVVLGLAAIGWATLSPWVASLYAQLNDLVLHWTLRFTLFAGEMPWASLDAFRFTVWHVVPFLSFVGFLLHFTVPRHAKILFVVFLIGINLAVFAPSNPAREKVYGRFRVSALDVGQGDAILLELPDGRAMMYDAGPADADWDAGAQRIVPYLKRKGIGVLDALIISHPHSDHMGGAPAILSSLTVKQVIESGENGTSALFRRTERLAREEGRVRLDYCAGELLDDPSGVRFYFLCPTHDEVAADTSAEARKNENTSLVVKATYGNVSFLLTGDAERDEEEPMVEQYGDFLHVDVLKVGHHGSKTGTTEDFLAAVKPRVAVISVGRNNKFHHPSPDVVTRLEESGSSVHRTDEEGAIMYETDGRTLTHVGWRGDRP